MISFDLVIPYFNRPEKVLRLLESIFNQDLTNIPLSIFLVDDASVDFPDYLDSACKNYKVNVVHLPKNVGPAGARNAGVLNGTSSYICFIDSDDFYQGNYFKYLFSYLSEVDIDLGWCSLITTNETNKASVSSFAWRPNSTGIFDYDTIIRGVHIGTNCGLFLKRDLFEKINGFDNQLRHAEDTDFLIRLSRLNPKYGVIDKPFVIIDKTGSDRVSINYSAKSLAYESIIKKNIEYLSRNKSQLIKYRYKLSWSYLHSFESKKSKYLLLQNISDGAHLKSFHLLVLIMLFGTKTTTLHVRISQLIKFIKSSFKSNK
jgi:glycosyltransferase involved in cell wall biosynthesis